VINPGRKGLAALSGAAFNTKSGPNWTHFDPRYFARPLS
jgi:hypothetical protein